MCSFRSWRLFALLATVVVLTTSGHTVAAQPARAPRDVAADREAARALAQQGLDKLDAGDTTAGIELIERAEARFHAPTHLLYLAQAHAKLGELARAAELYGALEREVLPNYAPDAFREAKQIGHDELEALRPRVASVRVAVSPGSLSDVELTVDGARVSPASELFVEPGAHVLLARRKERTVHVDVRAVLGRSVMATFTFAEPTRRQEVSPPRGFIVPGAISLGVGGSGLAAGTVTGVLSLLKVDQLSDDCPSHRNCPTRDVEERDDAVRLGNASTACLAIGAAATVAGIALVVWPRKAEAPGGHASESVRPIVGPGFAGVQGEF